MHNTIFITLEGGVIQNINITNDLENIKAVVVDFDTDGIEDSKLDLIDGHYAVVYDYEVDKIADGDVDRFENLLRRSEE